MVAPLLPPYRAEVIAIGTSHDGAAVELQPMTPEAARVLGVGLAAIDPWARVGYSAETFAAFVAATESGATRYRILVGGELAGAMIVRLPWLSGPYLHILGLLPGFQGRGVGDLALRWFEAEAQGRFRNLWLCVSGFNAGAQRFYAAHGYTQAATLDSLVFDGVDEHLMRKRLR